jgi:pyrrolidone-carboxylate peptidase
MVLQVEEAQGIRASEKSTTTAHDKAARVDEVRRCGLLHAPTIRHRVCRVLGIPSLRNETVPAGIRVGKFVAHDHFMVDDD